MAIFFSRLAKLHRLIINREQRNSLQHNPSMSGNNQLPSNVLIVTTLKKRDQFIDALHFVY